MSEKEYKLGSVDTTKQAENSAIPGPGGGGGTPRGGEKAKDFGKALRQLVAYLKPYRILIVISMILAAASAMITIFGPRFLSQITELVTKGIATGIDMNAVASIGLLLIILYLVAFGIDYGQGFIMATVTQRASKKLRGEISKKINRLPLGYFDTHNYGDVMSRVTNDVDTISQMLNSSLGQMVSSATLFLGSIVMMLITNWIMAIAAFVTTIIGFAAMILIIRRSQKYFVRQQRQLGRVGGHVEEIFAGHNIVKVYNGEKKAKQEFAEMNTDLENSAWKSQFVSGLMMPIMQFIGNLGYVVVCITGALLVINGSIDFSIIVAFMIYIRLFTRPLSTLAQAATNLQSATAAGERVFEFLGEEELVDESNKNKWLENVKGDVEFKNVRFGYSKEKTIIHDFSAICKSGQKVAIVGPTGAGKTTMVNLLMRFYELNGGEILIDGIPIQSISRENVHDLFCMVLQDTWLFEGTIKENIVYNKPGVTDEQVKTAAKAAGIHHFISTLPDGYDTMLNEENSAISAGQKQLLTIARAMVENAPMLILDEATSSVDTRTEALIQAAMDRLMTGRTSFVIAHRLSTIRNADMILVMKDGDIIESGTHDELLAKSGFYAELYNSQFEDIV